MVGAQAGDLMRPTLIRRPERRQQEGQVDGCEAGTHRVEIGDEHVCAVAAREELCQVAVATSQRKIAPRHHSLCDRISPR